MENTDIQQLEQQIAELQTKRDAIIRAQKTEAISKVRALISAFELTASDLGFRVGQAKAAPQPLPAKYRNPADHSQTWHGGKGPRPAWVKEFMANGGDLNSILI